jgi:hypothetical protein
MNFYVSFGPFIHCINSHKVYYSLLSKLIYKSLSKQKEFLGSGEKILNTRLLANLFYIHLTNVLKWVLGCLWKSRVLTFPLNIIWHGGLSIVILQHCPSGIGFYLRMYIIGLNEKMNISYPLSLKFEIEIVCCFR